MRSEVGLASLLLGLSPFFLTRVGQAQEVTEVVEEARELADQGRLEEAEALLRKAAESGLSDPDLLLAWSKVLSEMDREEEALRICERALSLRPSDDEAREWLAELYLRNGQPDSALEHLLILASRHPKDLILKRKIAEVLTYLDRNEEALSFLEAYIAAVPTDLEALKLLYKLYLWTDRPQDATKILERIVGADPSDIQALRDLAIRYEEEERLQEAISLYQRLALVGDEEAICALPRLYEWTDQPRRALEAYEACLKVRPFDMASRGRALELAMDLGEGLRVLKHAKFLEAAGAQLYTESLRRSLLLSGSYGNALGLEVFWFHDRLGFHHLTVSPWGSKAFSDALTVGARYKYHLLQGHPDLDGNQPERTVHGHEATLFLDFTLSRWVADLSVSATRYSTTWTSINAHGEARRDFDLVALKIYGERQDNLTTVGAVLDKVVMNTLGLGLYLTPWRGLFLDLSGEYSYMNPDNNQRLYGSFEAGYVIFELPRFEASYTYTVEHFTDNRDSGAIRSYFNPRAYQTHGPALMFRHPLTTWFMYGLNARLWHAVKDDALLITYGVSLRFRWAARHDGGVSYHRTDTIVGTAWSPYQDNALTCSYVFEF